MNAVERLGPIPISVLWVGLVLLSAGTVGEALADRSTAVKVVVAAGLWLGWAVVFGALLVPRSAALTVVRILVPGGLAVVVAALAAGADVSPPSVAALVIAATATCWVLMPWIGEHFVDGSSYGREHRLPLRPPPLFSLVIVPATWLAMAAAVATGPLLLASRRWVLGSLATVAGAAVVAVGVRALHQLSRRWVVLVPSGLVVHDTLTMPEPQLFLRSSIRRLGPALADSTAFDLTAGASGLALELELNEPVELLVRTGGRATATRDSAAVLITPTRPRRLLDAAGERRIPIG